MSLRYGPGMILEALNISPRAASVENKKLIKINYSPYVHILSHANSHGILMLIAP